MDVVLAWEERLSAEQLRKYTADGPVTVTWPLHGGYMAVTWPSSSANIQPTDHRSIALVYSFQDSMISGARYHRVATYSVMKPEWFSSGCATRASPKSHTW